MLLEDMGLQFKYAATFFPFMQKKRSVNVSRGWSVHMFDPGVNPEPGA